MMTAAQRTAEGTYYAVKRRIDLVRVLSPEGICAECGDRLEPSQLEIDHVGGRLWLVEEVSPSVRAARYWREHREGVELRVLCKPCSGTDGGARRYEGQRPKVRRRC